MKNNFFLTQKQQSEAVAESNEILPIEVRKKYADLKNKTGLAFARSRKDNRQLMYQYAIDRQTALDPKDPWRFKLAMQGLWDNRNEPQHVISFIEHIGMMADYFYISNLETYRLEVFVNHSLRNYGLKVTMRDLLECESFEKFFSQFSIENCDASRLDETKKLKSDFDHLLKGKNSDETIGLIYLLQAYSNSDKEFSTLHYLMNS